ncbi:MAG: DUF1272 domain-containing protein [Candidatus Krumholzibacteria bacterium]
MRERCEKCDRHLLADDAYICSYECAFCEECARGQDFICPNCAGELVRRPKRNM